jgi:ATP-dependent DNA helicase DinG
MHNHWLSQDASGVFDQTYLHRCNEDDEFLSIVCTHGRADDETSTLCGTMGLWHGVDVPGSSLSCLVLDKLPFVPMDDPLMAARRRAADSAGRDGFTDVFVSDVVVKLTQGVGRLIRTSTDRGVVAVLDTRLRTKGYGKLVLRSLPPMRLVSDRSLVVRSLERLVTDAQCPPAGASSERD